VTVFFTCHGTNARHPIRKPLNSSSNIFEHPLAYFYILGSLSVQEKIFFSAKYFCYSFCFLLLNRRDVKKLPRISTTRSKPSGKEHSG